MNAAGWSIMLLCVATLLWLAAKSGLLSQPRAKQRRHSRMIRRADMVLLKLDTFEGPFAPARKLRYLRKISPYAFEELLLTAFARQGYTPLRNDSYSGDGGIDGRIKDATGRLCLIQAKRYTSHIGRSHVIAFGEHLRRVGLPGFFIHTGRTPAALFAVARLYSMEIISGDRLLSLLTSSPRTFPLPFPAQSI